MTNSAFNTKYKKILEVIQSDFDNFQNLLNEFIDNDTDKDLQIVPIIKDFLCCCGKRIRPALIFLFAGAISQNNKEFINKIALANELLHNATLIHDDIIDCSLLRRGKKTLNFDYDNKLAVLAGDFLIAKVLKLLFDIEDSSIRKIHSQAVSKLIAGELHQYFSRYKLLSMDKYLEKSKDKTARLFEAGIVSVYLFNNNNPGYLEEVKNFALNFGTAFQIINDIDNFNDTKRLDEDIKNGDYSAPFIFYVHEKYGGDISKIQNTGLVFKQIKNSDAIDKTRKLAKHYINLAIENISFLEDNQYKRAIINLCNLISGEEEQNG